MGSITVNQELTIWVSHYIINRVYSLLLPIHLIIKTGNTKEKEQNPSLLFPFPCIFSSRGGYFSFLNCFLIWTEVQELILRDAHYILVVDLEVRPQNYLCLRYGMKDSGVPTLNTVKYIRFFSLQISTIYRWPCTKIILPSIGFRLNSNE